MVDTGTSFVSGKHATDYVSRSGHAAREDSSPFSKRILVDLVALSDMFLMVAAAVVAKYIYIDSYLGSVESLSRYIPPIIYCLVCFYAIMNNRRYYSFEKIFSVPHNIASIISQVFLSFCLVFIILFFLKTSSTYSRGWFLTWFITFSLVLSANRLLWSGYIKNLIRKGVFQKRVAVIGSGLPLQRLLTSFDRDNYEYRLAMLCNVQKQSDSSRDLSYVQCADIETLISQGQENKFDQVIVALPASEKTMLEDIVRELRLLPIDIQILPDLGGVKMPLVHIERIGDLSVVSIERKPISDWGIFVKNAADYVLGTIALLAFLPVMVLIAIAIKLDTDGPVFYRQRRHGFNHRIIDVLKFRTMTDAPENGTVMQATRNDRRITRVGKFLRKTSLDELPQLINVMRGEMSLVGPRPHAIEHNTYYGQLVENYANRHRVKPGITGWAQIHGLRGGTEDPRLMEARVKYDLDYIENWSIWLDLKILMVTPLYGFISRNAY